MIVISNIFVNHGGAGDYLKYLERAEGYRLNPFSYKEPNTRNKIGILFYNLYILLRSRGKEVVIYHPQTLTYILTSLILLSKSRITLYIIDANFFCFRSYNYFDSKPCYDCLNGQSIKKECLPYTGYNSRLSYLLYRYTLHRNAHKVRFFVQSDLYLSIVNSQFLNARSVEVRKMIPSSLLNEISKVSKRRKYLYDFAIHSNSIDAKGLYYFLELTKKLGCYKFLATFPRPEMHVSFKNVDFYSGRWSEELAALLASSRVILHPSLWTHPVEGSFLKSTLLSFSITTKSFFDGAYEEHDLYHHSYFLKGDLQKDIDMLLELAAMSEDKLQDLFQNQRIKTLEYFAS